MSAATLTAKKRQRRAGRKARAKISLAPVEIGTRLVDDPLEPGAKLRAVVNLREHPLEWLRARGHIDEGQYLAGSRLRADWEALAVGACKAVDTTREPVSGGGAGDPITDRMLRAGRRVSRVFSGLPWDLVGVLKAVVCDGRTLSAVAADAAPALRCGVADAAAAIAALLRRALDELQVLDGQVAVGGAAHRRAALASALLRDRRLERLADAGAGRAAALAEMVEAGVRAAVIDDYSPLAKKQG